jgi:hypothetical protein
MTASALRSGTEVTADCDGTLYTGIIVGFSGSGMSALIRLTADAPGYRAGTELPIPGRLIRAVA